MIDVQVLVFAALCLGPMALVIAATRLARGRDVGLAVLLGAFVLTLAILRNAPVAMLAASQETSRSAHAEQTSEGQHAAPAAAVSNDDQVQSLIAEKEKLREDLAAERSALEAARAELAKRAAATSAAQVKAAPVAETDAGAGAAWQQKLGASEAERLAASKRADAAERKLVLAEATIARLEAARAGAREVAAEEPTGPAPFSTAPPRATGPAAKPSEAASASPPDTPPVWQRKLAAGLEAPAMTLEPIAERELVSGEPGSYFRIACRTATDRRRVEFDAGNYTIAGGDDALAGCLKALSDLVLASLPQQAAR
ncbi:MAG: hypothetical protein JSS20_20060, partial [Proteobacteria bacterium]|nr:hypothetical protein [Pseudomonadota bacterium]